MAVCGLRCIALNNDSFKILGNLFSNNEKLKETKKCFSIKKMEKEKP